MSFKSQRCSYRNFGTYQDGSHFHEKHGHLIAHIVENECDALLDDNHPLRPDIVAALRELPEHTAFLKSALQSDFFFAAFDQSKDRMDDPELKRTGVKDVDKFVLERIKNSLSIPRVNHEFVVESEGQVVGYVELFDRKELDNGIQYERGIFIVKEAQSGGYGKEAIIALTDYAFKILGVSQIFTMVDPNNTRSLNNIIQNSGGIKIGEEESKYAHLAGGGKDRWLFHIYPNEFYAAVCEREHQPYLIESLTPQSATHQAPANQNTKDAHAPIKKSKITP